MFRSRDSIRWLLTTIVSLVALAPGLAAGIAAESPPTQSDQVEMSGGADFVIDHSAGLVYVSNRTSNSIKVVSLATRAVVATWNMPGEPVGVELSADRTDLFVALFDGGSVVRVDTVTGSVEQTHDIESDLGDPRTWELQRVGGLLYVSGNPSSNGFAWIVELDLATGDSRRVASNTIIRAAPEFAWDGADALYVGVGFSPNSLYKLDLAADDVPIVLEDDHGSVRRAQKLAVAPDKIHIGDGQVLDPGTFDQIGLVDAGFPAIRPDGSRTYVAAPVEDRYWKPVRIAMYDGVTNARIGTFSTSCNPGDFLYAFEVLPGDAGFVLLGPDALCFVDPLPVDVAPCVGRAPTIIGTPGADDLVGTSGDDVISGLGGRDSIDAAGGNDIVCGGGGADAIKGGPGADRLYGQSGNDRLTGGEGDDRINGGRGRDTVSYTDATGGVIIDLAAGTTTGPGSDSLRRIENAIGSNHDDIITGSNGKNVLNGAGGDDLVLGMKGADRLIGGAGHDDLRGGSGRDTIKGGDGEDFLAGGADADVLEGERSDDLVTGGPGNDVLRGGPGEDDLAGEAGDDVLAGGGGFDVARYDYAARGVNASFATNVASGEGNDSFKSVEGIVGSQHNDVLAGDDRSNGLVGLGGDDTIRGGGGHDNLWGGTGNDSLFGLAGDDFLDGESGTDSLNGGTGEDWCQNGEAWTDCEVKKTTAERTPLDTRGPLHPGEYAARTSLSWMSGGQRRSPPITHPGPRS